MMSRQRQQPVYRSVARRTRSVRLLSHRGGNRIDSEDLTVFVPPMSNGNDTSGIGASLTRAIEQGLGLVVAVLFWIIIMVLAIVATAQSSKPWDTLIAALAMASQAFFAFMVWRLGQAQYAFTQRVTDRQHKIDAFPLRCEAIAKLNESASIHFYGRREIFHGVDEKFRLHHVEVMRLFSDQASDLSFEMSEIINEAVMMTLPRTISPTATDEELEEEGIQHAKKLDGLVDEAFECYLELEAMLEEETRIL